MLAGVTTTAAGLVLTGTGDGLFLIFDGRSGRELYRFSTGAAIAGGVSTYEVGSRQYVAVLSGNASKSVWQNTGAATVIVFALPED
jgi:alcohol dehydrogenase (cytochrome c)